MSRSSGKLVALNRPPGATCIGEYGFPDVLGLTDATSNDWWSRSPAIDSARVELMSAGATALARATASANGKETLIFITPSIQLETRRRPTASAAHSMTK